MSEDVPPPRARPVFAHPVSLLVGLLLMAAALALALFAARQPIAAGLRRMVVVGTPYVFGEPFAEEGYHWFRCIGEECDGLTLELLIQPDSGDPLTFFAMDIASGLPPKGDALLAARPATAAPSGDGDSTLIVDRVVLEGS